jgi:hypothetical protein
MSGPGELAGQLLERRHIRWPPRPRSPQLRDAVRGATWGAQHGAQKRFGLRVAAAPNQTLQRADRRARSVLRQQSVGDDHRRWSSGAVRAQHLRRDLPRASELAHSQCQRRLLQRLRGKLRDPPLTHNQSMGLDVRLGTDRRPGSTPAPDRRPAIVSEPVYRQTLMPRLLMTQVPRPRPRPRSISPCPRPRPRSPRPLPRFHLSPRCAWAAVLEAPASSAVPPTKPTQYMLVSTTAARVRETKL